MTNSTSPFLNRIFYGIDKNIVGEEFINSLVPYMLTKKRKDHAISYLHIAPLNSSNNVDILSNKPCEKENIECSSNVEDSSNSKQKTIYPSNSSLNTLFWSVYIAVYGLADYQLLGTLKEKKRELEEKQKMLTLFMENPQVLKKGTYKMTNVAIQEYCSDLLLEKDGLRSLVGYSVFYKTNIVVLFKEKNSYLLFQYHSPTIISETTIEIPTIVLEYDSKTRTYGLNTEYNTDYDILCVRPWNSTELLKKQLESMFQLEHYEKPLKAIGNYKVSNLEDIAKRLNIDVTKMKKQEMYDCIYRKLLEN